MGTGDRSEKIRTYNYPQGRVTDHRVQVSTQLGDVMDNGNLINIIDELKRQERLEFLNNIDQQIEK